MPRLFARRKSSRTASQTPAPRAAKRPSKHAKYVYFFGKGKADGHKDMKDLLGGKGSGLAEMTNAGVPVPPGFTISTQSCNAYYEGGLPPEVDQQMDAALARLEALQGKKLGH